MNFIYQTTFISDNDTLYRLQMIPAHSSMLSNPETRQFASNTFLDSCIVKSEFDNLPIGMVSIMSMKLGLNVSALDAETKGVIFNGAFTSTEAARRVIVGGDTDDTITLRQFNGWITPSDASNFNVLRTEEVNINGFTLENVTVQVKQTAPLRAYAWQRVEIREIVDQNGNSQGFVQDYYEDSITVASAFDTSRSNAGNVWQLVRVSDSKVLFQGMQKRVPSTIVTLKSDEDIIAEIEITHIARAITEQARALDIWRNDAGGGMINIYLTNNNVTMSTRTANDVFKVFESRLTALYRQAVRNASAVLSVNGSYALWGVDQFDTFTTVFTSDTATSVIDATMTVFDFLSKLAENLGLKCAPVQVSSTSLQMNFYPLLDCIRQEPYFSNTYNDEIPPSNVVGEKTVRIADETIRGTSITLSGEKSVELNSANFGSSREGDFFVQTLFSDGYTFAQDGIKTAYLRPATTISAGVLVRQYPTIVSISKGSGMASVNESSDTSRTAYTTTRSIGAALEDFYLKYFGSSSNRVEEFSIQAKTGWYAHDVGTLCESSPIPDIAALGSIGVLKSCEHDVVKEVCKVALYVFDPSVLPA
jgi:hypothetical protein